MIAPANKGELVGDVVTRVVLEGEGTEEVVIHKQYQEARKRHPGMILLFRDAESSRYFVFDEDINTVQRHAGVVLGREETTNRASFSADQLELMLKKLLRQGHRVAVCDPIK